MEEAGRRRRPSVWLKTASVLHVRWLAVLSLVFSVCLVCSVLL